MATFTGNEGAPIPLATASAWTKNYRKANPAGIKGGFMGQKIISDLLAQEDCVGIRTYYAIDDNGVQQLVMVGVDANGNDLVDTTKNFVADCAVLCPTVCDSNGSPLI